MLNEPAREFVFSIAAISSKQLKNDCFCICVVVEYQFSIWFDLARGGDLAVSCSVVASIGSGRFDSLVGEMGEAYFHYNTHEFGPIQTATRFWIATVPQNQQATHRKGVIGSAIFFFVWCIFEFDIIDKLCRCSFLLGQSIL